ncbi:hypothetical protein ANANG_G00112030 [Anguilla anguilla]|uniref:NIPSNAP domain-containing protein n=1 Tax=Anguilla anguilla TaxID=7936 RepID=A0A9D3RZH3_ANGAN|nr:hypothetical protein ANANG_G00112030 [Anguilla anguilla]
MTALRTALRKACSITENFLPKFRKNSIEARASISTGPQQQQATFYEFRTYCIKPEQNAAFLKLTNEKIHLRTAHSELLGYWSVEYGGLNQVFHIWKYDSYAQRAGVRAALAKDPQWIEQYISKAMPMLTSQDNEVTYLVPWCGLQTPPTEGGAYELATFQMKPGAGGLGGGLPGGRQHPLQAGVLPPVHALWWYETPDQRAASRHSAHGDARVVAAVRESVTYLESQSNKLLFPTPSPPQPLGGRRPRFSARVPPRIYEAKMRRVSKRRTGKIWFTAGTSLSGFIVKRGVDERENWVIKMAADSRDPAHRYISGDLSQSALPAAPRSVCPVAALQRSFNVPSVFFKCF